ncbi:MAG: hypothetical protein A3E38_02460 [Candidatus Moranbacteria bacterium RIFCSPHIGHO2_12_FULL_54_9]|nr:MAG: hypothetical protein A2878_02370 [Candidatus Moranbacteria bacterium RIFCSPHIGHO2_01_FULL_54_31]OGI24580.1 MAG: hypothetical protein A3E38_02460 [Candidatus Moranbacteria bacterium RIFCSPHIGHO2_12_FULL_54_9]
MGKNTHTSKKDTCFSKVFFFAFSPGSVTLCDESGARKIVSRFSLSELALRESETTFSPLSHTAFEAGYGKEKYF